MKAKLDALTKKYLSQMKKDKLKDDRYLLKRIHSSSSDDD